MTDAVLQGRRHVIRSRVARLRAAHSYRTVLILIVAAFAFVSLAGDATWTAGVLLLLEAATLAVAVWTSGRPVPQTDTGRLAEQAKVDE